jgi:hypothetical protein
MNPRLIEFLRLQLQQRRLTLFTGAGFSCDGRDRDGNRIPTGPELVDELWELCFPGEPSFEYLLLLEPGLIHTELDDGNDDPGQRGPDDEERHLLQEAGAGEHA